VELLVPRLLGRGDLRSLCDDAGGDLSRIVERLARG
jgi:hypothetical protein